MSMVTIEDKKFVKYISEDQLDKATEKIAQRINEEYKDDTPIMICVLNGSLIFTGELLKKLTIQCKLTCMRVSSYEGMQTTGSIKKLVGLTENIENKRVIILEDIVDTGTTYEYLYNELMDAKAKDVKIATMTFKPTSYKKSLPVHFVGMEIPDKFIVGHGLDYNGLGRNLPDIYQVVEE